MNIIRRDKKIPVQARRVEPPMETVNIPGAVPMPVPPPAQPSPQPPSPGVTQNIFYVNVRDGQPAAPPPPQPEVHHHHITNVYLAPKRKRLGRDTSFLGTLGFVLGLAAIGAASLKEIAWLAKPLATAGMGSAALGLLGAVLIGRVGKTMPMLGLIVSALAYGLWLKGTGQLPAKYDHLIPNLPVPLDAAPTAATPTPNTTPKTPPNTPAVPADHSIFGNASGGWTQPAENPPPVSSPIDPSLASANLETARVAAAARLGLDYTAAKTADADAFTNYQQARLDYALGSPELILASKKHLEAESRLAEIQAKLRTDPAVAAAEAAVKNAKR